MRGRRPGDPRLVGFLYILPAFALYGLFVLAPAFGGAAISLFRWDGITPAQWAGLGNYLDAVADPLVREAFLHAVVLIAFYSIAPICLGLLVTAVLARRPMRGLAAFRTVVFLPQVLAAVVIGVAWQWMYDPKGPINAVLSAVGLDGLTHAWLGEFGIALPAVGVIGTWVTTGLCAVLFIAGVQQIPLDRYDAARVDGAGPVQEFRAVTLPGLRNEIVVALLLTVIDALRAFDTIFVTTKGGPGTETYVPTVLIYKRAFQNGEVGWRPPSRPCSPDSCSSSRSLSDGSRRRTSHEYVSRLERIAAYSVAIVFAVAALAPLAGVFLAALHPAGSLLSGISLPDTLSLDTFSAAWARGSFGTLMTNSVIVSTLVVVLTVLAAIPAGYAFGVIRFPLSNALFYVLIAGIIIPFEAVIIPLYYSFRSLGLTNSLFALILPQAGLQVVLGTFWMRAFFRAAPPELTEAASLDGASSWQVLWRVLVPVARPAILTLVVLVFTWSWNDFLLALVMISDEAHRTAPLGLSVFKSRYGLDVPSVSAASILVALPIVAIFLFTQRQFIRGVLSGSVKT